MSDSLQTYSWLCVSAALAGAINAIAGGGTLLTFPVLDAALTAAGAGVHARVIANATSTVALAPGSLASVWGYRREIRALPRWSLWLVAPSILGGIVGSLLLVILPPELFARLVPWLILTAALLFALQPQIASWTGIGSAHAIPSRSAMWGVLGFQFLVAVYGGYFGAGIGILMLSALAMMGLADIHQMNGLKTLLATLINGVSVVVFIADDQVNWPFAIAMAIAAIVGGYVGARVARKLDRKVVRGIVVAIGFSLASYYFYKQLIGGG